MCQLSLAGMCHFSSSFGLRSSRLAGRIGVRGNLRVLIIGLGRWWIPFCKIFQGVDACVKVQWNQDSPNCFCQNKIIWGKKEKKKSTNQHTLDNSQQLRLAAIHLSSELQSGKGRALLPPAHLTSQGVPPRLEALFCTQGKKNVFCVPHQKARKKQ